MGADPPPQPTSIALAQATPFNASSGGLEFRSFVVAGLEHPRIRMGCDHSFEVIGR
jgi:hypothetical protein